MFFREISNSLYLFYSTENSEEGFKGVVGYVFSEEDEARKVLNEIKGRLEKYSSEIKLNIPQDLFSK